VGPADSFQADRPVSGTGSRCPLPGHHWRATPLGGESNNARLSLIGAAHRLPEDGAKLVRGGPARVAEINLVLLSDHSLVFVEYVLVLHRLQLTSLFCVRHNM